MALTLRSKIVLVSALPLLIIHLLVFSYSLTQLRDQALSDQTQWLLELARAEARRVAGASGADTRLRKLEDARGRGIRSLLVAPDSPERETLLGDATRLSTRTVWRVPTFDGESGAFIVAAARLPGQEPPRELLLIAREAALLVGFDGRIRWLSLLFVLSASLILLVIWAVATRITEPLADLDNVVKEIAAGNLAVVPKASEDGEVGRLAATIGTMARRVEQRDGELRLARDNLERRVAQRTRELTREISRRQRVEAELRMAKEAAQQASQAKSDFLSNMSHELRTPLNGVLGYTQILRRDSELNEQQRSNLLAIEHCGEHLLTLINDVLDLAKIEAGRMPVESTVVDLRQLLNDVRDIVAHRARSKGLALVTDADPRLPVAIRTDGTKLRQILLNLLGNAIKFTEQGQITLGVRAVGERLDFEVSDTGMGIAEDELDSIFDAFRQADSGLHAGGTGLGLAINQHLISLMGGEPLQVASDPGQGSRFRFSIPLQPAPEAELPRRPEAPEGPLGLRLAPGQRARILTVDDSADSRDILRQTLAEAGFQPELAADAATALKRLQTERFDLVLMDIRMPGMSGLEAIGEIRDAPDLGNLPVIAITASVMPELMDRTRDAGFDDVIAKPFRIDDLLRRIADLLDLQLESRDAAEAEPEPSPDWPLDVARDTAGRLREAVTVGDMSALGDLAEELEARLGSGDPTLSRIRKLVRAFDFGGLESIADDLSAAATRAD